MVIFLPSLSGFALEKSPVMEKAGHKTHTTCKGCSTEIPAGELRAEIVGQALKGHRQRPAAPTGQMADTSTCWGCTLRGRRGLGTRSQPLPLLTGNSGKCLTKPQLCFLTDKGVTATRGDPQGWEQGRNARPPDSRVWFYQLSHASDHRQGAEKPECCPVRALTDGQSKIELKTLLMVEPRSSRSGCDRVTLSLLLQPQGLPPHRHTDLLRSTRGRT